jgi:hypothetical protein
MQAILDDASESSSLRVIFTMTEPDAADCVNEAVVRNGGEAVQVLANDQSILVALAPPGIRAVAARADVQAVDPEFDSTPPP